MQFGSSKLIWNNVLCMNDYQLVLHGGGVSSLVPYVHDTNSYCCCCWWWWCCCRGKTLESLMLILSNPPPKGGMGTAQECVCMGSDTVVVARTLC
jgi:hypothetical protein